LKAAYAAIVISIAFSCTQATAESNSSRPSPEATCALEGVMAGLMMGFRQLGVPLSSMMHDYPERQGVIMRAYEYPRYQSDEMIERAKEDFVIEVEMDCFRSISQ
jgi:hypothetical protein